MSFRDTRNFLEMLRALGYPNLISMESFRSPNFALTADLIVWLAKRFDPDADIPLQIETEDERVKLIRNAAQFMALKANIKLNTRRLYQADGYAVKELLKLTSLLYEALNVKTDDKDDNFDSNSLNLRDFDISDKVNELKLSRQLASEISSTGATLFELLGKEVDLRPHRQRSVGRQFELSEVETGIKKAVEVIKNEIRDTKQLIENVSATESNLDAKIDRRKVEIERYEKRLQTLKKVRPAFLDEFTTLEKELEDLFLQYSVRLRCLNHLEQTFKETERAQYEKQMLIASPRVETIPFDKGEQEDAFVMMDEYDDEKKIVAKQERPRVGTGGGRSRASKIPKAYGAMQPIRSPSGTSIDLSSDTDSDDLFLDKDEPELMISDDESLTLEIAGLDRKAPSARITSSKIQSNSDDDF